MTDVLLSIHLLAAVVWVGGGIAMTIMALRMTPADRVVVAPHFNWYGSRVLPAAAGVLILAGFGLVSKLHYSVGDTWIIIGLVIWVASAVIGTAILGPVGEKINRFGSAGDADGADAAYRRLLFFSRIDSVLVALAVIDMAVKPGA